ncbi:MAG: deoxyribodipyrimidine photo-lyase [Pseudomonadota bacterium]
MQVVWFKRDLRLHDHAPLVEATARGRVLPLYIVEPELWQASDVSGRHWAFLRESLVELRSALAACGQPLVVRVGAAVDVLSRIHREQGIDGLWSHQETGNAWTYARDRAVAAWCRAHGVQWHQPRQFGVVRALVSRKGWARRWDRLMAQPVPATVTALHHIKGLDPGSIPSSAELGLGADPCPGRFAGGRTAGLAELKSFLQERGEGYQKAMSSPLTAFDACSRLSAHLSYGTLSMREISQAARSRLAKLKELPANRRGTWPGAVRSFLARLHWHCHFMQKLEDEPDLEFDNLHSAYNGLREDNAERLERWATGTTGYPFVDACMRALAHHGWINFRMRAMLASFASYHLWLPWRASGLHLARQFTDYEPGIHWPQMQMQSATTGINLPRIYNPIKQGRDFDADGAFIRQWVPELEGVPGMHLHEPWKWQGGQRQLGRRYPVPIVDERAARQQAQERIWLVRRQNGYREIADRIQAKHGSRKSGIPQQDRRISAARQSSPGEDRGQLALDLAT